MGGNSGQALAPLISAFILVPLGQKGAALFLVVAAVGIFLLSKISAWYKKQLEAEKLSNRKRTLLSSLPALTKKQIGVALTFLWLLFLRDLFM